MGIFDRFRSARQAVVDGSGSKVGTSEQDALRLIDEGHIFEAEGRIEEAMQCYLDAIRLAPNPARAHLNHGNILLLKGDLKGALDAFRTAIKHKPDYAGAYYNIGNALLGNGQYDEAIANYRQALEINPDYAEVSCSLGVALKELGQLEGAVASFLRALEINPDLVEARTNLGNTLQALFNRGNVLMGSGQLDGAVVCYRRVLELQPDYAEAHTTLGVALKELGQLDGAVASYWRALEINPDLAEAHSNLGFALQDLGQLEGAVASYRRALELKPDFAEAYNNLGNALKELGQFDGAEASYRRALELKPDFAEAHNNLGNALKDLGQFDGAEASYRRALELKPDHAEAHSNLLFVLNYTAGQLPSYYLEQARQYGRIVSGKVGARFSAWQCAARPERLRVGLVSGDLLNHPVGFFLEGLLAHIDQARIELIAYPTHHKEDELTARIRPYFSAWKPLIGKSDEAAARLIHADGVHILLDISGHTAHNRLPVFAWKPAPVQASWLGYFATTGVAEMDYILVDEVGVPEAQRQQFTESIWYLPDTRLCFSAPGVELPVAPLPALSNGMITFGCFQNLAKVGDDVLATWEDVFAALPDARLRIQCKQLGEQAQREQLLQRLKRHGIDPARVELHGAVSREDYLAAHAEVDLILDTFPYPGGTTTCEALWMGVPTLTLAGDSLLARQGASLLTAAGLEEWVAASKEEYIAKAIVLANDKSKLATLRAGLRQQVLVSPLFDAPRFARNFEDALWRMWQAYQAQQEVPV
jgi:predicted O-linked N-acetylglucosamine transferase (SPINDLY family)